MIELEQLQHFITFQECETLSKAAKQLEYFTTCFNTFHAKIRRRTRSHFL